MFKSIRQMHWHDPTRAPTKSALPQYRIDRLPTTSMKAKPGINRRKHSGSIMVEFALVVVIFISVMLSIFDFGYLFLGNLSMQHAVREGARYAIVGRSDLDPDPQGTAQDRCDAAIQRIKNQSMGFSDRMTTLVTFKTVNPDGSITPVAGNSCPSATQIIVITVDCSLPLLTPTIRPFFPDGAFVFSVSTAMRNEAF